MSWETAHLEAAEEILAAAGTTREELGRQVRRVWTGWAGGLPPPYRKPSWLTPWEELDGDQREADMRIGQVLFILGWAAAMRRRAE